MAANYLTLSFVRLPPHEAWQNQEEGFTFVFPKSSQAKCTVGNFNCLLGAGDVLVLSGDGGKIRASGPDELVFGCFTTQMQHFFPLFDVHEFRLLQNVTSGIGIVKLYPASAVFAANAHRLLNEVPSLTSSGLDLDHRSQLLRIAATVFSLEFKAARDQRSNSGFVRMEDHMIQVFEKLAADEITNLSVDELAERFHCSKRHLNRLFHQYFGFSISGLKMEMRLLKAVSLLRNRDSKIIHVAQESGFDHMGLFNTCFKKRFGASPSQWRKLKAGPSVLERAPGDDLHSHLVKNGLGRLAVGSPTHGSLHSPLRSVNGNTSKHHSGFTVNKNEGVPIDS